MFRLRPTKATLRKLAFGLKALSLVQSREGVLRLQPGLQKMTVTFLPV